MDKKSPKIYGLLGFPVRHSLSPAMHNEAFRTLNIPAEYRLFEVKPEDLEDVLLKNIPIKDTEAREIYTGDIAGFNITVPHKVRAKEILEKNFPYSNIAKTLPYVNVSGAVNTAKRKEDGTLDYINTDVTGFAKSLKEDLRFETKDKNILLIGCGGAGRAIVAGLIWKPSYPKKIYIYEPNSEAERSAKIHFKQFSILDEKTQFILKEEMPAIIEKCRLLVNASPVGMEGEDVSVVGRDFLHKDLYVYDVVYSRDKETRLIKDAKEKKLPCQDGLGMLLHQGVLAFGFWIGNASKEVEEAMRNALNREVKR